MIIPKTLLPILAVISLALPLAGCGDRQSNPFSDCGNGICDSGEQCDDGALNQNADQDQCLSTCKYNRCGDGFVNRGPANSGQLCDLPLPDDVLPFEDCDPGSLEPIPCATLGFQGDRAGCTSECQFDTSSCGAPFTPTPTSSSTPSPTSTPTVTPTVTPGGPSPTPTPTPNGTPTATPTRDARCGNGTVEPPETCDDGNDEDCDECPNDCMINSCDPTDTRRAYGVSFEPPGLEEPISVTFFVNYPDGTVSLPGSGFEPGARMRVFFGTCDSEGQEFCERNSDCPEGGTCTRPNLSAIVNDFDHGLRVVLTITDGLASGPAFAIDFDDCAGATPPSVGDFACKIQGCTDEFGLIDGCACSIEER